MKGVLSYCLFEPKSLPQHRFWDKDKNNPERYWFNIPAIAVINDILYPDYETKLYVSKNIWDKNLSLILKILSEEISNFVVETVDRDYKLTEPAIWRMLPLWSRDKEIFHTRDLDSIPNEEEYKFIRIFEKSCCTLGTIRTHENHYGIKCRMLAGLSSFKPQLIPLNIKGLNFDTYYATKHLNYGSDQDLMIQYFTENKEYTKKFFLDFATNNQKNEQDFPCVKIKQHEIDNFSLSEEISKILVLIKNHFGEFWAGIPLDTRGPFMNSILDLAPIVGERINSNNTLREFYQRSL